MIDSTQVHVIERVTRVAPFGVRFWDTVSGSVIGDGLSITAYPPANPALSVQAFVNRSGVYALQNVPGLRAIENGAGDANFWATLPPGQPFVIEVIDSYRRFQPFLFTADLPVQGLFTLTCGPDSPPLSPLAPVMAMVPLFSTPTRPVTGGMAVLRADLWDLAANVPASWALLTISIAGLPLVSGFADFYGRIALIFPYPPPVDFIDADSPDSPIGMEGPPLTQQQWAVQLQAAYTPLNPVPLIPDLCTTLTQLSATLWVDAKRTQPLTQATLVFGQELIVRSQDTGGLTPPSVLLITPAGSPP